MSPPPSWWSQTRWRSQLVEQRTENPRVAGSIPAATTFALVPVALVPVGYVDPHRKDPHRKDDAHPIAAILIAAILIAPSEPLTTEKGRWRQKKPPK